ncbi:MAG: 16S rRNA (cytidine(1402)-2'-O)-methyltransferase [Caldisericia bacterium]|nr:16S rRNA (cytidine(1402)-2'-O)-methyltransferase [Caldisericia bacterium]
MNKGKLFIVSGPIGNLDDITIRALKVLRMVDLIVCEDTRVTSKLLNRYRISKRLISYHEGNEKKRRKEILSYLSSGKNIALMSDAGTPCISDPGEKLIDECIKEDIEIKTIPGPSSVISSLVISGIKSMPFLFIGFLPKKEKEREKVVEKYFYLNTTIVFFESPHRLIDTINYLAKRFPERKIALIKELTKIHEEVIRGTLKEVADLLKDKNIKGEWTVVLEGGEREEWESDFELLLKLKFTKKDILKFLTNKYKGIRNKVYKRLELKDV